MFYSFNSGRLLFVESTKLIYTLSYNSSMFDQISLCFSTTLFDNKSLQSVGEKKFFLFVDSRRSNLTVQKLPSRMKKLGDPGMFTHYKLS